MNHHAIYEPLNCTGKWFISGTNGNPKPRHENAAKSLPAHKIKRPGGPRRPVRPGNPRDTLDELIERCREAGVDVVR